MCLIFSVELAMKKADAKLIVSQYESINLDLHLESTNWFFSLFSVIGSPRLSISEKDEGCACSLLTDDADWNDPTWDLRPDLLPDLALALLFISELVTDGYIFEALWVGDHPERRVEVSIDELLQIVQSNQIGQKARYIVRAAASGRTEIGVPQSVNLNAERTPG
jgi:hypothetical protein